ncbi:MAG: hypothetical protein ABI376_05950 [Caulobacteraceae bacterium]
MAGVGVVVGSLDAMGAIGPALGARGAAWTAIAAFNDRSGALGFVVIGLFAGGWIVSVVVFRLRRYDLIRAAPPLANPPM